MTSPDFIQNLNSLPFQDILLGLTTPIYCAEDESLHQKEGDEEEEEEEEEEEVEDPTGESWPGTSQSTFEKL